MSIRDGKAKADQVLGRVAEVLGQSYADPAAEVHGEALRLRGEAEEDSEREADQRLEDPGERAEVKTQPQPARALTDQLLGDPAIDADLRARVLQALVLDAAVPTSVHAHVRNGLITLTGTADYRYQRDAAEEAARRVAGVVDVSNEVGLSDTTHVPAGVQNQIRRALVQKAKLDADRVTVLASEGTVTLSGRVGSREEHDVAVAAAQAAPGVHAVDDRLIVVIAPSSVGPSTSA